MKPLFLLAAILTAGSATSVAADHTENRRFLSEQLQRDGQRFRDLQTPEFLKQNRAVSPENQAFLDSQAGMIREANRPAGRPVDGALVLVSFSMPEDDLKQRVRDASALGIPAIIRGMVNGEMRDTANAVAGLVKETNSGGVEIDPVTFRKYGVTAVPVLIVTCGNQGETYDRLQGDLTLYEGLRRVAQEGECADTAKQLLGEHE